MRYKTCSLFYFSHDRFSRRIKNNSTKCAEKKKNNEKISRLKSSKS